MSVVEFVAPRKVYIQPRMDVAERLESSGYSLGQPIGLAKTKTGGLATWFQGHPFPRKTFIYPGIVKENNKAKRIFLALFLPFASIRHGLSAFVESYVLNFSRLIDVIYADGEQIPYLHYQYYSEFGKVIRDFTYLFLRKLGIKSEIAYRFGLQLSTMIEYDDAYRMPMMDVMNESVKEDLLKTPRKELLRLAEIFKSRTVNIAEGDDNTMGARMIGVAKVFSLLMYVPWIKKAFVFAISNVDYDYFRMDESDKYWLLNRGDYNSMGLPFEQRKSIMIQKMVEFVQETNPDKDVRVEEENGETLVKAYQKNVV